MSSVFVYVGQCGNQIGGEFLSAAGDYAKRRAYKGNVFHSSDGKLKSVHVDTESKVLASTVGKLSPRYVREENVIRGRGGRGNNFAFGYYGLEEGDCLLEQAIDAIRKEAERCESFSGIVITHSLAGGTGSGLGARLTVRLRDEFPIEHLLSCVVHPIATGETPLQHYNELLCLAKLYECSDGVVVYSNDAVLRQAQRSSTAAQGQREKRSLSFASINKHIASSLCGLLFPNDTVTAKSCCSINMEPWEMLRSLCPMPTLNFVTVDQHATREASWTDACSALLHGWHKRDSEKQSHFSSLASILVARGKQPTATENVMKQLEAKVRTSLNCVPWNPFPVDAWKSEHTAAAQDDCMNQLVLASNYSSITEVAEQCWSRAKVMFGSRAYLHWYWRHGADEDMFGEAFEAVASIVRNYDEATSQT